MLAAASTSLGASSQMQEGSDARAALFKRAAEIARLIDSPDASTFLRRLFCHVLGWSGIDQPIIIHGELGERVAEATLVAHHQDLHLCHLGIFRSQLGSVDRGELVDWLGKQWPIVMAAFSSYGQGQIDLIRHAPQDQWTPIGQAQGFDAWELVQAVCTMRALEFQSVAPQVKLARDLGGRWRALGRSGVDRWCELPGHQLSSGERGDGRDKLVLANLWLVEQWARSYRNRGVDFADLLQEGVCGLMNAADRFNPSHGGFTAQASWWIRQAMIGAIASQRPLVAVPKNVALRLTKLRRFCEKFLQDNGFSPSDQEIATRFKLTPGQMHEYRQAVAAWNRPAPLEANLPASEQEPDQAALDERNQAIAQAIDHRLDSREQEVVRRRFGLDGAPPQTLQVVGTSLSVTREWVRQIEIHALARLGRAGVGRKLEAYYVP
jgi:RNA polymerase sigma factor (sigma-70 family)